MSDLQMSERGAAPQVGGTALPQSHSTGDLMQAFADSVKGQAPAGIATTEPSAFLAASDGKTYKQVHAEVKAAQIQGGVAQTPPSPTMQALLAPDELSTAQALTAHTDPLQQGAAAGVLSLHASRQPDGLTGAQAEYARVDSAYSQGLLTDPKLKKLYGTFRDDPTRLSPDDANELNMRVSQVASATDVIQNPHLKLRVGKLTSIDSTPDGPLVQVQFDPKEPLDGALVQSLQAADTELPIVKPTTSGLGVYVAPSGTVGVVAPSTREMAVKVRHLYPCLIQGDHARWLPGAPRKVSDGEALRRRLDEQSTGHVGETFDAFQLTRAGGHPATVAGTHIAVDVEDGYQLARLAHFGQTKELGTIQRSSPAKPQPSMEDPHPEADPSHRDSTRARRVLITLDPSDAANVATHANEILDTKNGTNLSIYAHDDVQGFTRAREHLYTDGVTTHAHRTVDGEHTASHGFDVWVKDATGLPSTAAEGSAVRGATFTPAADRTLTVDGGFGRIIPAGTGTFETHGRNVLNSTHGGRAVVGFGVFNEGRAPDVVLAFDEETAQHLSETADVYGKPVGNGVEVAVDQSLAPAALVAEAMRLIGVDPKRIIPSGQAAMSG